VTREPRIAHLGIGAFARSHQAWYTFASSDDWGIAAFPSRSHDLVNALAEQDGRYGLVVRGPQSDSATTIDSIVEARADGFRDALARPETAILTLTVTEAGYAPGAAPMLALADGLRARCDAGAGPMAIVPCDNVPANAHKTKEILLESVDEDLRAWINDTISFVFTMVDRITPATTPADVAVAQELLGWADRVPVVTEPFTEWVLQGDFPAGRPEWERAGAQFVPSITPYENRKLWMLNGAHSLLAYRGLELGFETVYEAFGDAALRSEVDQLWDEARPVLDLPPRLVDDWLAALRIRWANPRIEHRLTQIALGGAEKIPARIFTVDEARREAGLPIGIAGVETVAAWRRYEERTASK
jgi:fructuronate reductase